MIEVSLAGTEAWTGVTKTILSSLESASASNLLAKVGRDDGGGTILVAGGYFGRGGGWETLVNPWATWNASAALAKQPRLSFPGILETGTEDGAVETGGPEEEDLDTFWGGATDLVDWGIGGRSRRVLGGLVASLQRAAARDMGRLGRRLPWRWRLRSPLASSHRSPRADKCL